MQGDQNPSSRYVGNKDAQSGNLSTSHEKKQSTEGALGAKDPRDAAIIGEIKHQSALRGDIRSEVRKDAVTAVYTHPQNQWWFDKFDSIEKLVSLLSNQHPFIQELAATMLCELARNPRNRELIVEAGGIAPLVSLRSSQHPSIQELAEELLWKLARNPGKQEPIAEAGKIRPQLAEWLSNLSSNSRIFPTTFSFGDFSGLFPEHLSPNKDTMGVVEKKRAQEAKQTTQDMLSGYKESASEVENLSTTSTLGTSEIHSLPSEKLDPEIELKEVYQAVCLKEKDDKALRILEACASSMNRRNSLRLIGLPDILKLYVEHDGDGTDYLKILHDLMESIHYEHDIPSQGALTKAYASLGELKGPNCVHVMVIVRALSLNPKNHRELLGDIPTVDNIKEIINLVTQSILDSDVFQPLSSNISEILSSIFENKENLDLVHSFFKSLDLLEYNPESNSFIFDFLCSILTKQSRQCTQALQEQIPVTNITTITRLLKNVEAHQSSTSRPYRAALALAEHLMTDCERNRDKFIRSGLTDAILTLFQLLNQKSSETPLQIYTPICSATYTLSKSVQHPDLFVNKSEMVKVILDTLDVVKRETGPTQAMLGTLRNIVHQSKKLSVKKYNNIISKIFEFLEAPCALICSHAADIMLTCVHAGSHVPSDNKTLRFLCSIVARFDVDIDLRISILKTTAKYAYTHILVHSDHQLLMDTLHVMLRDPYWSMQECAEPFYTQGLNTPKGHRVFSEIESLINELVKSKYSHSLWHNLQNALYSQQEYCTNGCIHQGIYFIKKYTDRLYYLEVKVPGLTVSHTHYLIHTEKKQMRLLSQKCDLSGLISERDDHHQLNGVRDFLKEVCTKLIRQVTSINFSYNAHQNWNQTLYDFFSDPAVCMPGLKDINVSHTKDVLGTEGNWVTAMLRCCVSSGAKLDALDCSHNRIHSLKNFFFELKDLHTLSSLDLSFTDLHSAIIRDLSSLFEPTMGLLVEAVSSVTSEVWEQVMLAERLQLERLCRFTETYALPHTDTVNLSSCGLSWYDVALIARLVPYASNLSLAFNPLGSLPHKHYSSSLVLKDYWETKRSAEYTDILMKLAYHDTRIQYKWCELVRRLKDLSIESSEVDDSLFYFLSSLGPLSMGSLKVDIGWQGPSMLSVLAMPIVPNIRVIALGGYNLPSKENFAHAEHRLQALFDPDQQIYFHVDYLEKHCFFNLDQVKKPDSTHNIIAFLYAVWLSQLAQGEAHVTRLQSNQRIPSGISSSVAVLYVLLRSIIQASVLKKEEIQALRWPQYFSEHPHPTHLAYRIRNWYVKKAQLSQEAWDNYLSTFSGEHQIKLENFIESSVEAMMNPNSSAYGNSVPEEDLRQVLQASFLKPEYRKAYALISIDRAHSRILMFRHDKSVLMPPIFLQTAKIPETQCISKSDQIGFIKPGNQARSEEDMSAQAVSRTLLEEGIPAAWSVHNNDLGLEGFLNIMSEIHKINPNTHALDASNNRLESWPERLLLPLSRLDLSNNATLFKAPIPTARRCEHQNYLRELYVRNTGLDGSSFQVLCEYLPQLCLLDASNNLLSGTSTSRLDHSNLKVLRLASTDVSGDLLRWLGSSVFGEIESLDLSEHGNMDECMSVFSESGVFQSLRKLSMLGCHLTAKNIEVFVSAPLAGQIEHWEVNEVTTLRSWQHRHWDFKEYSDRIETPSQPESLCVVS